MEVIVDLFFLSGIARDVLEKSDLRMPREIRANGLQNGIKDQIACILLALFSLRSDSLILHLLIRFLPPNTIIIIIYFVRST